LRAHLISLLIGSASTGVNQSKDKRNETGLQQRGVAAAWCLGRRPPGSAARFSRRGVYAGGDCLIWCRHFPNNRRVVGFFRKFLLEVWFFYCKLNCCLAHLPQLKSFKGLILSSYNKNQALLVTTFSMIFGLLGRRIFIL
jgi:hypothetical protein